MLIIVSPTKQMKWYRERLPQDLPILSKNSQMVTGAGQYLIFNPWDAHKPKAANGEPAPIKKVIVKIKED